MTELQIQAARDEIHEEFGLGDGLYNADVTASFEKLEDILRKHNTPAPDARIAELEATLFREKRMDGEEINRLRAALGRHAELCRRSHGFVTVRLDGRDKDVDALEQLERDLMACANDPDGRAALEELTRLRREGVLVEEFRENMDGMPPGLGWSNVVKRNATAAVELYEALGRFKAAGEGRQ